MKTLLVRGSHAVPGELRQIIEGGSTELTEVARADDARGRDIDRVVEWNGREIALDERRLQWPEDEDELRMLFQTGG